MPIDLKNKVAIIGVGCTRFGELYESSAEQLIAEAAFEAFADAGVEPKQIEGWTGKNATPAKSSAGKNKAKAKAKSQ